MSKQVIMATRQLALLTRLGHPLGDSLRRLGAEAGAPAWLKQVGERVDSGDSLARAVQRQPSLFSSFYVAMAHAAETSERASEILTALSWWLERTDRSMRMIRHSLYYPILVLNFLVVQLVLLFAVVVPQVLLPLARMEHIGNASLFAWLQTPLLPVALVIAILTVDIVMVLPLSSRTYARLPWVGRLVSMASQAMWSRAVGVLLGAGVDLPTALQRGQEVLYDDRLVPVFARVEEEARRGATLSDALVDQPTLNPRLAWSTAVGESHADLARLLVEAADDLDGQVERRIRHHLRMLEPWALLLAGSGVAMGLVSYWWPFYSMVGNLH